MENKNVKQIFDVDASDIFLCPQCGCGFVHIPIVTMQLEKIQNLKVNNGRRIELNTEEMRGGADYRINLQYDCESGHKGTITFWHHEGNTYIEHETLPKRG
jgi:hypothetical protein